MPEILARRLAKARCYPRTPYSITLSVGIELNIVGHNIGDDDYFSKSKKFVNY